MKTPILATSLSLLSTLALHAAAPVTSNAASSSGSSASSRVEVRSPGTATITIEVNGKKETREIELGNTPEIKVDKGNSVSVQTRTSTGTDKAPKAERHTFLGVIVSAVSEEVRAQLPLAEGMGLLVRSLSPESPAAVAGLRKNDILIKFDDQLLTNPTQLRTLVETKKEGDSVRLTFLRRAQEQSVELKLGANEGGDEERRLFPDWLQKGVEQWSNFLLQPSVESKTIVVDKDGNVITSKDAENPAVRLEALEKTLRDAGVPESAIEQAKKALIESATAVRKAAEDLQLNKEEIGKHVQRLQREMQEHLEEMRKKTEGAPAK